MDSAFFMQNEPNFAALQDRTSKGYTLGEAVTQASSAASGSGGAGWRGMGRRDPEIVPERTRFSVATRFLRRVSVRLLRSSAGKRTQPRHVAPREVGGNSS